MGEVHELLGRLAEGRTLAEEQAERLFEALLSGSMDEAQIGAALGMIQSRGANIDEIVGAARVMRRHVTRVPALCPPDAALIDTCGTGGAPKTFNVSTAAAIIAASAEGARRVLVAKHGNRSRTGRGSAEVLAALGVNVDATPAQQARCLDRAGVCFCFAIHHHPAMKHAAGPRRSLGFPTIFNVLGPLTNPAGATRQLIGVYAPHLVPLLAGALERLGAQRCMVVHAHDGLDEFSIGAPTTIAHVGGAIAHEELDPASLAISPASIARLQARDVEHSAQIIRDIFAGAGGAPSDMACLNASAALVVGEAAPDFARGLAMAREAVNSGAAAATLDLLARASHEPA